MKLYNDGIKYTFGGYIKDNRVRFDSTSGGAFSAIVNAFCDQNYAIFGATSDGLSVFHTYITDVDKLDSIRKSKYSQSKIGMSYAKVDSFLTEGKKVLFSGTPCQIAGLKMFLNAKHTNTNNLLTVEVVCEGVPSPLYIQKYEQFLQKRYGGKIEDLDYRYTGKSFGSKNNGTRQEGIPQAFSGKWDFQIMRTKLVDRKKVISIDRWFNPFWSIWLKHLMSRPSCYECMFAQKKRTADITLGDLWGVHLYCPELYGNNVGASVVFANTEKGKSVVIKAETEMYGHELITEEAIKYQSPMRKCIDRPDTRAEFMADLKGDMSYQQLNRKWAERTTFTILWKKYIWGNRQKVWLWKLLKGKYRIR